MILPNGGYFIATPEKALCDKIYADKRVKNLKEPEVLEYLEEDLRIDYQDLLKLDSKLFWYIAYGIWLKSFTLYIEYFKKDSKWLIFIHI